MQQYPEYEELDLPALEKEMLNVWEKEGTFEESIQSRENASFYVFYEGPPSANGLPGIHHVMARTIKDLFCRFNTLKGYQVKRKAGWDTHGLPVEISVEKELGITKEDIGEKISIADYNEKCRENVMKYKDVWDDLTRRIGFWLDMEDPYITYENKYIESVWNVLQQIYDKGLMYKGYTIQPYSPMAGTGLSSHELNQPGCYKEVTDISVTAQFKVVRDERSEFLFDEQPHGDLFFLAWTTTPWTLPSNTALGVGPDIDYAKVRTFNRYTGQPITVILAEELLGKWFDEAGKDRPLEGHKEGDEPIPYQVDASFKGSDLRGVHYEQIMPYTQPEKGKAFEVLTGDFVTTEEGTGVVHLAPSFGADDFRIAYEHGIGALTLVDERGRFTPEVTDFAGEYVKEEYYGDEGRPDDRKPVDVRIAIKLKEENKAFLVEKYQHSYPHCWRTDKPILYYPLDSWFIQTTAVKDRLFELNKTINWKPESTGTKRFGNWLENLQDWNLSRSRFWGIPIPVWTTEDRSERRCIGSLEELKEACEEAVRVGMMERDPLAGFEAGDLSDENYDSIDLHRPYVDDIVLVSPSGKPMYRENDLIDVWFDSGSMPYAQWHYPFENQRTFADNFPADLIAEGVDQTRGWFFTLHAIAGILYDSVAYKNVVSNGLVLDKHGQKMSKRLGNVIDPFETLDEHGPDATRWYMLTNAQPWDNLRFDLEGLKEVKRKFFGTLYNTYGFFAMYANIDGFRYEEEEVPVEERSEMDRWVISLLNTLVEKVDGYLSDYEPTHAGRAIQDFVIDDLSNWYVRLNRRRFWKGAYNKDKVAAYQTLYRCLEYVAILSSPFSPFYMDRLYRDLNEVTGKRDQRSVHVAYLPEPEEERIDKDLEQKMKLAQKVSSLVLSLRKKQGIRVRQPLRKLMVPVLDETFERQLRDVEDLVLSEVNVKELEYIKDTKGVLVKSAKPDFKKLGPKHGKLMKALSKRIEAFDQDAIAQIEKEGRIELELDGETVEVLREEVVITSEDVPGQLVASEDNLTVALDITIDEELRQEGIARELVNKLQHMRKDKGLEVTDKIRVSLKTNEDLDEVLEDHLDYIKRETLAEDIQRSTNGGEEETIELLEGMSTKISLEKL